MVCNMINEFITYLRSIKGYSENTCKAYEANLRNFAGWYRRTDGNACWSYVTRERIDDYICYLVDCGYSPASTNRSLSALSSFYNYQIRQGRLPQNPCKYESRRKVSDKLPNTIPMADLCKAYQHANGVVKGLLGLLITTGIRIEEALSITWADFDAADCSIRIHGKGQKERMVYTTTHVLYDLRFCYPDNSNNMPGDRCNQPCMQKLFKMTQREARWLIYNSLVNYTQARQLSPHAIRHTYATEMAKRGTDIYALGKAMGHSDMRTTQKYIAMAEVAANHLINPIKTT